MGVEFLSDEWFSKAEEVKSSMVDFQVPSELAELEINVTALDGAGDVHCRLSGGVFQPGHADAAAATLILPKHMAYSIFIQNDQAAGMQGFMSGELRVEGDMSTIMSLQSVRPTESQKDYQAKIQAFTAK